MPLDPSTLLLDRYRIEGILAQGGFGAVYVATDENLGLRCAVKENLSVSPASERQFQREARLLATLRHPHLPRVTNHFASAGQQYLVMDLVEGDDLAQRIKRQGRLGEEEVLEWTQQICEALIYLHTRIPPVIHRDIKPANIKITPSGVAVLVDFGIAKAAAAGQTTSTGAKGVTPGFAPPEQYDLGQTETRTDIYALGATLYNLLTGLHPPDSVERLIGMATLVPPEVLRADLSPHVASAIRRAMEVEAERRFQSVAQFANALADPGYRYEPKLSIPPAEVTVPPPLRPRLREWRRDAAKAVRGALPSLAGMLALLAALAIIFIGPGSLRDLAGRWIGSPVVRLLESESASPLQPAAFVRETPTRTPTTIRTPVFVTPTPVSLPTPTPRPQTVSRDNAGSWRLFARWVRGEPSVPFALNPQGDALAMISRQGVDIFDLLTGDRIGELQGFVVGRDAYELAHQGDSVLVQFADEILRYDLASKNLLESIRLSGRDMLVSADGSMLAVREEYIRVLNLQTGELQATLGEKNTRQRYAFSPDGRIFALTDKTNVELYDSRSGHMRATLAGHGEPTQALAFSADGIYLVSASGDVWEVASGDLVAIFDSSTTRIAISPNNQVIVGDDGSVWALETGESIGRIPVESEHSLRLLFTPDGQFLIRQTRDGAIELWTVDPYAQAPLAAEPAPATLPIGEEITTMNISRLAPVGRLAEGGVSEFVISPDWSTAATWDRTRVTIISLVSGEVLSRFGVSGQILDVDYLGTDFVTVANALRQVERWEISTGRQKQTYDLVGHTIQASQMGDCFAVQDKYIQVVDAVSGERTHNLGSAVTTADKYEEVPRYAPEAGSESGIPFQDFAFSPDGSLLAITEGSAVGLWELEQGTRIAHLSGHGPNTHGLAFTPDGSLLLSSSGDVWEVATGTRIAAFDSEASSLAISPTGELVAGDDGSLWDGASGQYLGDLGFQASALWFTPNNRQLVIHSLQGGVVLYGIEPKTAHVAPGGSGVQAANLVDLSRSTAAQIELLGWWGRDPLLEVRNERDHAAPDASKYGEGEYAHIALARDGRTLIALDERGVDFLDPASGQLKDRYRIFMNPETAEEIAALGEHLLLLKADAGIERWDLANQAMVARYNFDGSDLLASPDGERFALRQGNKLLLVDASSGQVSAQFTLSPGAQNVAFSAEGRTLAVVRGSVAELWDLESAERIRILHGHAGQIFGLVFSPDGEELFAASGDRWEVASGERLADFESNASQVAITPRGDLIIGDDGALRESQEGQRIATLLDLRAPAAQWLISRDGRQVIGRSADGRVHVWGVRSSAPPAAPSIPSGAITVEQVSRLTLQSHLGRGRLQDAVWSPDRRYLAINTALTAQIMDASDLGLVRSLLDARVLAFDPGGRALVGGAQTLRLIDPISGDVIRDFGLRGINQATFSRHGTILAIAGQVAEDGGDDGLAVITLANGLLRVIDRGRGVLGYPIGLELTPDSRVLVASFRGTITIWEVESGRELRQAIRGNIKAASISPDGQHLAYFTHRFVVEDLEAGGQYRTINADGTPFFATGLDYPAFRPLDYGFTPEGKLLVFYRRLDRRSFSEDLALIEWNIHDQPVSAQVRLEQVLSLSDLSGIYLEDYANEQPARVPAFGLNPAGTMFYSLTGDGMARIWDMNGDLLGSSRSDSRDLMALDPQGRSLAVSNAQGEIEILDLSSGELLRTLPGIWSPEWMGYSSASALMLIEGDGKLSFLDATRGTVLTQYSLDAYNRAEYFTLGPEGRLFANVRLFAGQNFLQVFSLNPDDSLMDLDRFPVPRRAVFSPDGKQLAMVRRDRVELWDLASGSIIGELEGIGTGIGELAFTPDGARLIAATGEIWDLARGELAAQFETSDPAMSICTNGYLLIGSDGSLWDAKTGDALGMLPDIRGQALSFTFTPDGERLVWQLEGGVIEVWGVSP